MKKLGTLTLGATALVISLGAPATQDGSPQNSSPLAPAADSCERLTPEQAADYYAKGRQFVDREGADDDYEQAKVWLTKAAEAGNPDAMYYLALVYDYGELNPLTDGAKALYWHTRAAEAGQSESMTSLGIMYQHGLGAPKETDKAVYWFQKSAQLGNHYAMSSLSRLYSKGVGVEKDAKLSKYWSDQALKHGGSKTGRVTNKEELSPMTIELLKEM